MNDDAQFQAEELAFQMSELITTELKRRKMPIGELAQRTGLARRSIQRVIHGGSYGHLGSYAKIFAALELRVDVVLQGEAAE